MAASWPAAVKTFTAVINGVTKLVALLFNSPYDEIEAIQTYLGSPGTSQANNASMLNFQKDGYSGFRVYKKDTDEIYVDPGAAIISGGGDNAYRVLTSRATLTASDLDTGSFAADTIYYVFITADSATTTPSFIISLSRTAPTGITKFRLIGWFYNETISVIDITKGQISSFTGGGNRNFVNFQTGAVNTGSTIIPFDDTIPQITEGDEYMTLKITPTNASNKLKIEVVYNGANSAGGNTIAALFQDATANSLACGVISTPANENHQINFTHYMAAGTTSAITFRVRAGDSTAGTTTFNGQSSVRKMGGVVASSITITEIQ